MNKLLILGLAVLTLSACADTKKTLGLAPHSPDEFKVMQRAPLEIPESFVLPTPQPGAQRPQEAQIPDLVKRALTGKVPGESQVELSDSERALLQKTRATQTPADIRSQVDRETQELAEKDKSVTQRILGVGGLNRASDVLDAKKEAERLEKEQVFSGNE